MSKRKKLVDRYRRFSFLSDIEGMKNAIGEMKGKFFPGQPHLNKDAHSRDPNSLPDEEWFIGVLKNKMASHADNQMEYPFFGEPIFEEPLIGFVRGNDPIFDRLKEIIGPHHFTPWETMRWQAEKNSVKPPDPEDISVVSFVMPFTQKTRRDNAAAVAWTSERWAQTRLLGEIFSQTFVREIITELMGRGILAIAPDVTPMFNKKRYPKVGWASPWSHRHIAYAAGLGTFGMHDFLITEKGVAHRLGSFVVNLKLEPDQKRPEDIHAHCRHYQGQQCLQCAKRCPVDAITVENAHNKETCAQKVADSLKYCNRHYHIFIYGCGLCATGVPCESEIPKQLREGAE
jgi:epoxyqueuosine reductase